MTLSWAAGTTLRRTTEQVWLPYHPLHITNPPHIIRKQAPHARHTVIRPELPLTLAPRLFHTQARGLILWLQVDEQHGPRTSSIFIKPGPRPWVVLQRPQPPPPAGFEAVHGTAIDVSAVERTAQDLGGG